MITAHSPGADAADFAPGYIGRVPVRNIWLLMLYASELYRELPHSRSIAAEEAPDDIPNLVAEILTRAVARRMRRNLSHDYRRRCDDLHRVRGRINLLRTERRQLLPRGRVACIYDELTVDTPRNRFVKAALAQLAKVVKDADLAGSCRAWVAGMQRAGVSDPPHHLNRPEVPLHQAGHTAAADRQMLAAAQLAFDLALPTEDAGPSDLRMPYREEAWIRRLFEYAVAGFYNVTLSRQGWRVRHGSRIPWPVENPTAGLYATLPSMQTDIVLEHRSQRIIIDTKFTSVVSRGNHRERSLRSSHIYQIYAYIRSQERPDDLLSASSAGILLYPAIEDNIDESAIIQGHEIRFATIDLAADGRSIRRRLLDLPRTARQ